MISEKKKAVWPWILAGVLVLVAVLVAVGGYVWHTNEFFLDITLQGQETLYVECAEPFEDPGVVARFYGTLLCRTPREVEVTVEGAVDCSKTGVFQLTYHASFWKLTSQAQRTVVVVDTSAPLLTVLGDSEITLEVGGSFRDPGVTAFDNVDGNLTAMLETTGSVDPHKLGTYEIVYSVADREGNSATATRVVHVKDTTAPVLTLEGSSEMQLYMNKEYTEPGFTASDNYDADVTQSVTVEGSVDTSKAGTYVLTYSVADSSGNVAQAQRTVSVVANPYPQMSLSGGPTVDLLIGTEFVEPGYYAWDDTDGNLTASVQVTGNLDITAPGTYELRYSVTNSLGNTSTLVREVYVFTQNIGSDKVIYLTFDDGPGGYTSRLLDILDQYGVKVTFFVTGKPGYVDTIARAAASGHTIGLHTYTHDFANVYASVDNYFADLYRIQSFVQGCTGQTSTLIRFPGGSSNSISRNYCKGIMTQLTKMVGERGFTYFDWNVDCGDAGGASNSTEVYNNLVSGVSGRSRSVVLCHDTHNMTVNAMEKFIPWALRNGYAFLPLSSESPTAHHGISN